MTTPFTQVIGLAIPLPMANVDTDTIIRIEHVLNADRTQLGHHAFSMLRRSRDGELDPRCPFNMTVYRDAPILVAGRNFGCGSSRENAVWAIQALGIRCIIAESFGDIFASNCHQNGVLPVCLPASQVAVLSDAAARLTSLQVDLERRCVAIPTHRFDFVIDEWRRERLLSGLGDIEYTMTLSEEIAHWQAADQSRRPWVWKASNVNCNAESSDFKSNGGADV